MLYRYHKTVYIQVLTTFLEIPELLSIVDGKNIENDELFLRTAFKSVLTCDKTIIAETISNIIKRYDSVGMLSKQY